MNLNTVNVVEVVDRTPRKLVAFPDTSEGNSGAEALFTTICEEHGLDFDEIEVCIDEGSAPATKGSSWELFLIHSENP